MRFKQYAVGVAVFWGVVVSVSIDLFAQEPVHVGRPQWRIFDTRTGGARTTHQAYVDSRGIIYGANDAGLISFDGVRWRLFDVGASKKKIHTLEYLDNITWLVGGPSTLGIFSPNDAGKLTWTEKFPELGDSEDVFSDTVVRFHRSPPGLLVLSDRSVLLWSRDSVT